MTEDVLSECSPKVRQLLEILHGEARRRNGSIPAERCDSFFYRLNFTSQEIEEFYDAASNSALPLVDAEEEEDEDKRDSEIKNEGEELLRQITIGDATRSAPLSHDEARQLAKAYHVSRNLDDASAARIPDGYKLLRRGRRAYAKLVQANQGLVRRCANFVHRETDLNYEDLIQEGNLGLLKAIEKWDPDRGYRFSTYAVWWIYQSIHRALANQGATIRIPVHAQDDLNKLRKLLRSFENTHGTKPSNDDISEQLGASVEKAAFLQKLLELSPVSLDQPVSSDESLTIGDTLASRLPSTQSDAVQHELVAQVDRELTTLTGREEDIIRRRFGIGHPDEHTLENIGNLYGITRERVRQIEAKALSKLKHPKRSRALRSFLD